MEGTSQRMKLSRRTLALGLPSCLAGCGLASLAPTNVELMQKLNQDAGWDAYMVKITPRVMEALAGYRPTGFPASFRVGNYTPNVMLKPGDTIGVTVYENSGQPLFGSPVPPLITGVPGQPSPQSTTLPLQIVEADGTITVPYVGRVHVGGETPGQAAALIQKGLETQTVRPQVVVSLVNNVSNTVAVGGEVTKAGLMPLTLRGERVLDAVAWAGGPKWPPIQIDVHLMRGSTVASVPLLQVMENPDDNIVARPNDSITLVRNPKTYVVMGAAQKVSTNTFNYERVTLAEAVAGAGGGLDSTSNMRGIYLFRYETASFARMVFAADEAAVDTSHVKSPMSDFEEGKTVPVFYQINLSQADGYFFAQQINLRDRDIVLITTADSAQFIKIMQIVRSITGTYYDLTRAPNN